MTKPSSQALSWAAGAVATGASAVDWTGLRKGAGPWLVRFEGPDGPVEAVLRVGDPNSAEVRGRFGTEAAALVYAEDRGLAAPRLIALDLDGAESGATAVLTTVLPGSSQIPRVPSADRLRALGAAAAALHAVSMAPRPGLPLRERPLADVDFAAVRRSEGSSILMTEAEDRVSRLSTPRGPTGLVHGDLWQGNTMWIEDTFVGMIDWDAAGAGQYGVDLGSLRCDAAILFGPPAADQILDGWRQAIGREADDIAYWDTIAALCTPTDMTEWLAIIHDDGRSDLDARTIMARRDSFLRAALDELPS